MEIDDISRIVIFDAANIWKLSKIVSSIAPRLPYHNYKHMVEVTLAANNIAKAEGVSDYDRSNLITAGILHDVIYIPGRKDNEELAAEVSKNLLYGMNYNAGRVCEIAGLILATKFPTKPNGLLEQIISDADLDYLGTDKFFPQSEALREEFGVPMKKWYEEMQPAFLKGHKYYTNSERIARQAGIEKNLALLGEMKW